MRSTSFRNVATPGGMGKGLFRSAVSRLLFVAVLFLGSFSTCGLSVAERTGDGLLVLYTFEEKSGDVVHDQAPGGSPLDLRIDKLNTIEWTENSLRLRGDTMLRSLTPATKIRDRVKQTNELTLECWIRPLQLSQAGPARIVSVSSDSSNRNLTLGQDTTGYDVRLRTKTTSNNGLPSTATGKNVVNQALTHVVYSRAADGTTSVYLDGKKIRAGKAGGGLENWDASYHLLLGNEQNGGRPWKGEFHLVAIYDRVLSADEVQKNFQAGATAGGDPEAAAKLAHAKAESHFATQIAPILARNCLECHDTVSHKGGLDLSRHEPAFAGGESGPVIVPGKVSESLLIEQIISGDMPPQGPPLSKEQQTLLADWVADGAVWSVHQIDPAIYSSKPGASQTWVQRLTVDEYVETVRSAVGVDIDSQTRQLLPADLRADGFSNTAYNLTVDMKHVEAYAQLARMIVDDMDVLEFAKKFSKSQTLNTDASARKFVEAVGTWLLRGPLTDREITNYSGILTSVASAGGTYEQGVALLLEAMLQSPRFVYRVEYQRGSGTNRYVSDYELASRISYIVWGGPPDDALYQAAKEGRLSDRRGCRQQVRRMLDDPRAKKRSQQFVRDWLNLDRLTNLNPNKERFPDWTSELGYDMRDETLAFFDEVIWKQNRPMNDLFYADFTFATPRLAKHYGLKPQGDGLRRYDLSNVPSRGGILTQGSVLTIGGDHASMVTRGLFVLTNVLRGVIGAPPPGTDTTPVPTKPGQTHRTVAEERIQSQSCGGCHLKFEPLAFGLEPYDGLGAFHIKDEYGNDLRADGELLIPGEAKPVSYSDTAELMRLLAASERVQETMVWKLTQFALGRPLGPADAIAVDKIGIASTESGATYSDLITEIVLSDLVLKIQPQQ